MYVCCQFVVFGWGERRLDSGEEETREVATCSIFVGEAAHCIQELPERVAPLLAERLALRGALDSSDAVAAAAAELDPLSCRLLVQLCGRRRALHQSDCGRPACGRCFLLRRSRLAALISRELLSFRRASGGSRDEKQLWQRDLCPLGQLA